MSQGESERCGAPTAQARSSRDSISHHCILSLKALNSNDIGYWHFPEVAQCADLRPVMAVKPTSALGCAARGAPETT